MRHNTLRIAQVCAYFLFACLSYLTCGYTGLKIGRSMGNGSLDQLVLGNVGVALGESVGFFFIGVAFYALRRFSRLIYGIIEFAVAIVGLLGYASKSMFGKDIEHGFDFFADKYLVAMAALYVLVRALDNIGEGLKARHGGRYPTIWTRLFPEYTEQSTTR